MNHVLLGEFDRESLRKPFGAWYPNAEFKTCLNAGHYPMQEMPTYYVAAIEAFMGHCQINRRSCLAPTLHVILAA
jgi:hypothetical protein